MIKRWWKCGYFRKLLQKNSSIEETWQNIYHMCSSVGYSFSEAKMCADGKVRTRNTGWCKDSHPQVPSIFGENESSYTQGWVNCCIQYYLLYAVTAKSNSCLQRCIQQNQGRIFSYIFVKIALKLALKTVWKNRAALSICQLICDLLWFFFRSWQLGLYAHWKYYSSTRSNGSTCAEQHAANACQSRSGNVGKRVGFSQK